MINWDYVYKLAPHEFSEDPDKYAEENLIYYLGRLRKKLGKKMRPSPVPGALARFDSKASTSQHYCAVGKKSKASDQFIESIPFQIFCTILDLRLFNAIGIYLDTKGPDGMPWVMFHLDIRRRTMNLPLIWIVEKIGGADVYRYPQSDPKYWSLFNDSRMYQNKQFGVPRS